MWLCYRIVSGILQFDVRVMRIGWSKGIAGRLCQFSNFIAAIEGREELAVPEEDCYRITEVVLKLRDAADTFTLADL